MKGTNAPRTKNLCNKARGRAVQFLNMIVFSTRSCALSAWSQLMRYFLHIRRRGQIILDREGSEHADLMHARVEARLAATEILANAIREGKDVSDNAILISDEGGRELAEVPFATLLPTRLRQKLFFLD